MGIKTIEKFMNPLFKQSYLVTASEPKLKTQTLSSTRNANIPSIFFQTQRHSLRKVRVMSLFGMGLPEVVIIAGVAALVFGPSKLPELGKSLGVSVKSFQSAAKEFEKELKSATTEEPSESNQDEIPKVKE